MLYRIVFILTAFIVARDANAQFTNAFNIRFQNIPFQNQTFNGFAFQTPVFQTQTAPQIRFQNIQFQGLDSVSRVPPKTVNRHLSPDGSRRFDRPWRGVPRSDWTDPRNGRRYPFPAAEQRYQPPRRTAAIRQPFPAR